MQGQWVLVTWAELTPLLYPPVVYRSAVTSLRWTDHFFIASFLSCDMELFLFHLLCKGRRAGKIQPVPAGLHTAHSSSWLHKTNSTPDSRNSMPWLVETLASFILAQKNIFSSFAYSCSFFSSLLRFCERSSLPQLLDCCLWNKTSDWVPATPGITCRSCEDTRLLGAVMDSKILREKKFWVISGDFLTEHMGMKLSLVHSTLQRIAAAVG